ncbi:HET-domain-containing protein [Stipitochalara longipes BDJ]|nr:HET-domain-containing protein [Stipitochalara longipes BDJ]
MINILLDHYSQGNPPPLLQPRTSSETVTCTTKYVKLSEKPQYEALSYQWGAKDTQPISFNGRMHPVQQNLFNALLKLRHETEERVMWIDALCINQNNVQERNHQVAQMGGIYKGARCVVVWLGLVDEDCVKALDILQSTEKYPGNEYFVRRPWFSTLSKKERALRKNRMLILESFRALSLRSYWTRLWVVQEILLASQLRVQCGEYNISWERLYSVYSNFWGGHFPFDNINTRKSGVFIEKMVQSRMGLFLQSRPPNDTVIRFIDLYDLCTFHGGADCEREIDNVFGLSALALDCCQRAVPIDYELTLDQVLERVFNHSNDVHRPEQRDDLNALALATFKKYREIELESVSYLRVHIDITAELP